MRVSIDSEKLDLLANAISDKSGEPTPMTLAEMTDAVDGIDKGITPTGNIDISQAGVTDVTDYATATVQQGDVFVDANIGFYTQNNVRKWHFQPFANIETGDYAGTVGFLEDNYYKSGDDQIFNAIASGTSVTPTESAQTIGGANYMMAGAVTVNAIPSNYVGTGITRRSSSDLTASGATVTAPAGYYASSATKTVASGTAGTPTATKGTVSNHSVSVTPSVTNTTGYITGSTKTGTAVTVSASELVSGSQTITQNGTVDVTNLAEVVVDVQGGGGTVQIGTKTATPSTASSSIQFTGLPGNPTSFVVTSSADVATNTSGVTAVVFDGSALHGQTMTTQVAADTGFTKSYSNGTLTITATTAQFRANAYKLVYTYGGSSSDIETADVQVGSGATSITFPVVGRPAYWSCIFKSNFSTSSGYQRVIAVANDGSTTYGLAMDSSAHAASSWTATYGGGNFTISSQSTNVGGYFHQPGYYQLTYYVDESAPSYQTKTVTPTTSQQTVTPDTGYDALSQVTVNAIPSEYIIPTGNYAITQNGNNINVAQYATVSVNVSGGGGVNVATTTWTNSSTSTVSHRFTGLSGTPKAAFLRCTKQLTRSSSNTYYYIADIVWDGTTASGNYHLRSNGSYNNVPSTGTAKYNVTVETNSITFSSTATSRSSAPGSFYNGTYELTYVY